MNQRVRRNQYNDSSGSNVLFTLGLVSVVALLIIGWVMTKGGMNADGSRVIKFSLSEPTPLPTPVPATVQSLVTTAQPDVPASSQVNVQALKEELTAQYEQMRQQDAQSYEKRVNEQKRKYEAQIAELNTKIQFLEIENRRLRGE